MRRVVIFHTSDMHNRLDPRRAALLRELKRSEPKALLLDSGDAIRAGNTFWIPGGEPVLDLMSQAGYDAMCVGNREYHFTGVGMNSKTSRALFPLLSANLRARDGAAPPAQSHIAFDIDGLRVCVFGLSVPCVTEEMLVGRVADYYFIQPIAAALEIVPALRAECDLLVALTHIGIAKDRDLAEKTPGIDLILGGHTHTVAEEPQQVVSAAILHHGYYARTVGRVTIEREPGGGLSIGNELIPLEAA